MTDFPSPRMEKARKYHGGMAQKNGTEKPWKYHGSYLQWKNQGNIMEVLYYKKGEDFFLDHSNSTICSIQDIHKVMTSPKIIL